jgi:hypothetical protein
LYVYEAFKLDVYGLLKLDVNDLLKLDVYGLLEIFGDLILKLDVYFFFQVVTERTLSATRGPIFESSRIGILPTAMIDQEPML